MGKSYKRWKRRQAKPVVEPVAEPKAKAAPEPKKEVKEEEAKVEPAPKTEADVKPRRKRSPLSKLRKPKPADD